MNVYNSQAGLHEIDSDITIINPSIMDDNNDENLSNTQITTSPTTTISNNNSIFTAEKGYIFVHHDPLENAKNLEKVLIHYIGDLKKDSNTQLNCDKQLVTRIMDLIRPAYTNDEKKLLELDQIIKDIGALHDKRYVEQKEKIEYLNTEINRLNKMIFTASNDHSLYDDTTKSFSIFNTLQRDYSIHDHNQWTEIEDDAKKLHSIIQSQENQINEIVTLVTQSAMASTSIEPSNTPSTTNKSENITTVKQPTQPPSINSSSTLLDRIRLIIGQPLQSQPITTTSLANTTIINPSPGSSPTESITNSIFSTITSLTMQHDIKTEEQTHNKPIDERESINEPKLTNDLDDEKETIVAPNIEPKSVNEPKSIVKPDDEPKPVIEPEPIVKQNVEPKPVIEPKSIVKPDVEPKLLIEPKSIVKPDVGPKPVIEPPTPHVPVSPEPQNEPRKCPVCNKEFPLTAHDVEVYDHIEKCLFPTALQTEPRDYECPNCQRKLSGNTEADYLQHLSDCYNSGNF